MKFKCFILVVILNTGLIQSNEYEDDYPEFETKGVPNTFDEYVADTRGLPFHVPMPRQLRNWPEHDLPFGEITGVSVNLRGQPVFFHRGPREFTVQSFNSTNDFQFVEDGPIMYDTVVTLDSKRGTIIDSWGGGFFYLPHGITIDHNGNIWLTDVAMHQVFKFSQDKGKPILTLGNRFKPGSGLDEFCMPTTVAVGRSGHFWIADGYCNSRILRFNENGEYMFSYPRKQEFELNVPHSIALMEAYDLLCIADRDNERVICIDALINNRYNPNITVIEAPDVGRVFAIWPHKQHLYAVNGPTSKSLQIRGFVMRPLESHNIVRDWKIYPKNNVIPHDLAMNRYGSELYVAPLFPKRPIKFAVY